MPAKAQPRLVLNDLHHRDLTQHGTAMRQSQQRLQDCVPVAKSWRDGIVAKADVGRQHLQVAAPGGPPDPPEGDPDGDP